MNPIQDLNSSIMLETSTAVLIVKMLVDLVRMCWGGDPEKLPPHWVSPASAFIFGIATMVLMGIAIDLDLTRGPIIARTVLSGIFSGATAIGVTELHNRGRVYFHERTNPTANPAAPMMGPNAPRG